MRQVKPKFTGSRDFGIQKNKSIVPETQVQGVTPFSLSLSHSLTAVSAFLIKLILWLFKNSHLVLPSSFETFNVFPDCF